ncbi:MAG: YqgE/AlgH family protein [Candidatus Thiodiazotropha sp. (ex Dulcina madagascariensis)]|nr:YqgE/AlgH family protein [Candidatus Thiodiazotropha sp. (ex Epidulcina cf. delphinae)]MCU7923301.1 YqgE/AlgH family protein [Candidatus Thiodiazotropha sp. (ex Dulcina madagascariensis)]MCU7927445.1 YqgE/AlgH family protein [Candidatus Thiodiazotropha sp. (ex Dulcina madagascariensis)]
MRPNTNLTDHFLIAMPRLEDPNFFHTVTYICEHTSEGAMGIVINRPMELHLADIFEQLEIRISSTKVAEQPVYIGGPVQSDRGFVLHDTTTEWASTLQVTQEISVTTSLDILEAIAGGKGPHHSLVALGYAGWGAGQLENELAQNAWLSGPAQSDIIFNRASQERWQAAADLLGVDLNLLSGDAGHA